MKVSNLIGTQYVDFLKFNAEIYPQRKNIKERFKFQVLDNPLLKDKSRPYFLVAYNEKKEIIGQFGLNPFKYYFKSKQETGFCGFDLFVAEKSRKQGVGSSLVKEAINRFKPIFAVGVSEVAKNRYSGFQLIGEMNAFVWVGKFITPVKWFYYLMHRGDYSFKLKKTTEPEFPEILSFGEFVFKQVLSLNEWEESRGNEDVLKFSRSVSFLNWRFSKENDYCSYLSNDKQSYFVVKKINWKGLNLLLLVDYQTHEEGDRFKIVLRASKLLAKIIKYDGIIAMSSHRLFDTYLKKNLFFKRGKPSLILTNAQLDIPLGKVKERESLFMTMADADFEFAFW